MSLRLRPGQFVSFAVIVLIASGPARAAGEKVDFERDVKPILVESCIECHGADKQKGGLRLDVRSLAMEGGNSGRTIVTGQGSESSLVRRMRGLDDEDRMPLKKPAVPEEKIKLIEKWIDQGAAWAESDAPKDARLTTHWAFVKPVRHPEPAVRDGEWGRNAIDRFILARLETENLKPSREAPRETLLRRVSLDLTGLPPTIEEIGAFVADRSPAAYEKVVERLLASPHYGERWGRHWLDAARYADSNGYSIDAPRSIWPYRDWVISALNADMPFDQFMLEQLAGDLLPSATPSQKIATGFHRNTQINEEGGIDPEQFRVEATVDRVNTTATVFLGLTMACAQCHNHKFDPLAQREYYQLFAFFNNVDEPKMKVGDAVDEQAAQTMREQLERLEADLKRHDQEAVQKADEWELLLDAAEKKKLRKEVRDALAVARAKRSEKQQAVIVEAVKASDPDYPRLKKDAEALKKQLAEGVSTLVVAERMKEPRKTHLFVKGDFTRPAEEVKPGVPRVLHPLKPDPQRSAGPEPQPTRIDLAKWLADPENPLTARVVVNRMWQQYFGKGIVETENDFGTQGIPPTHPELLDWLATELIRQKWSLKAIHRLIVTSAVYRQSSNLREELVAVDPYNKLLGRQNRVRLEAEIIRDVALSASGLLVPKIGGPSVFPPQPEGVMGLGQVKRAWRASPGADRYRRGMYTFLWRATPHPLLSSFDAPDAFSSCTRRVRSNTPLQALTLLNDQGFVEFAKAMGERIVREGPADDAGRIDYAFKLCTSRRPTEGEQRVLMKMLEKQRADGASEGEAWMIVARVVLNLDETITRE